MCSLDVYKRQLVADTAVRGDPRMIQWVPRELRTADLCLYAEAAHPELRRCV